MTEAPWKDIAAIKEALARIEENLKEHMRRTHNLEGRAESIEKHVWMVQGVFKFIGLLALLTSIVGGVVSLYVK